MTSVAVVGAGVMGRAAAWALAARGAEVTLYDQFALGHARGSSHGRTRIVRLAYSEPEWIPLAREALAGWRELERESGRELLGLSGLVELAPRVDVTSADVLVTAAIEHRVLAADDARSFGVALPAGWAALWQPEAGFIRAEAAMSAFLDVARVPVRRERVDAVEDLDAAVVVVAAGPWVRRLVPDVPVRVTSQTVAYFRRQGPPTASVVELAETRKHAMYALYDPEHGLKAGAHGHGHEADPDVAEGADPELVERIAAWVRERLPDVDPEPVGAESCLYTSTGDESFVLERRGRVVVCSACSGHGFKFAPAVGRRVASLALGPGK